MRRTELLTLPANTPGTHRTLQIHRFGPPGTPRAMLQASLHADELPGMLVLHHLLRMLEQAPVLREIVVVPFANPIGLSQFVGGSHLGRYEQDTLENFNRRYPELTETVASRVHKFLSADPAKNIALIRAAMVELLDEQHPADELTALRLTLMKLAAPAEIVLDLHCDYEAEMHLYLGTPLWPDAADLAAELGAVATLTAMVSGGNPFDEAVGGPWWALQERFPAHPIPPACLAATVELRGESDVDDDLALADAQALFRFLQRRGWIAGHPPALPALIAEATPLAGVDMVRAPSLGLVVWKLPLGARVTAGALLGEIIDPSQPPATARTPLRANVPGVFFSRCRHHLVRPGQIIAKVAGAEPIRSGHLLTD